MGSYINLMHKATSLVLQDIWHQNPKCGVREEDLVLLIFEKNRNLNLWMALVEVKSKKVSERFYEVTYQLEADVAHVTAYRAQSTNPYTV